MQNKMKDIEERWGDFINDASNDKYNIEELVSEIEQVKHPEGSEKNDL